MEFSCYEISILVDFVMGHEFSFSSVLGFAPFWLGLPWAPIYISQAAGGAQDD
jgi:hypothetical protein